ncbi:MAG: hypothetical protein QW227_00290 [Candidatus Aenigmatarchaeota archaeon]
MKYPLIFSLLALISITLIAGCAQAPYSCTPNWQCSNWTTCVNNIQTRTCYDAAACNTTEGKPAESQSCIMEVMHYTGNISQLALNKEDMTGKVFWTQRRDSILNITSGSDIDIQDGLESVYKVTYRYDNSSIIPEIRASQGFVFFDYYQVIFAFPIVNGVTNSSYLELLKSKDTEGKKKMLYDDIVRLQDKTIIMSYDSSDFEELSNFGIADEEFVYRFKLTNNQYLYGIVFKNNKTGILEKIWINGFGTKADILQDIVTKAWSKA